MKFRSTSKKIVIWGGLLLLTAGLLAQETMAGLALAAGIMGTTLLLFFGRRKRQAAERAKERTGPAREEGASNSRPGEPNYQTAACPACRAGIEPGDRYCPQCGIHLQSTNQTAHQTTNQRTTKGEAT